MSNPLATNAVVPLSISTPHYLKTTKNGVPINRQVPRTYQKYTGVGNQTITYDGSNEIIVFGSALVGPLIIQFGALPALRNWIGRKVNLIITGPCNQTITLDSSPASMKINGTALTQLSHVIPGDNLSKCVSIYFHSENLLSVDYGASIVSINGGGGGITGVTNLDPNAFNVFRDIAGSNINLKSIADSDGIDITQDSTRLFIRNIMPQTTTYATTARYMAPVMIDVSTGYYCPLGYTFATVPQLNPQTEGVIDTSSFPIIGYTPAPRQNRPVSIPIAVYNIATPNNFIAKINPYMINVHDKEYIAMTDPVTGGNQMFDMQGSAPGGQTVQINALGSPINLGVNASRMAVDQLDSVIFFTLTSDPAHIYYYDIVTGGIDTWYDITTNLDWPVGATIADMDYCEKLSYLIVAPNTNGGRIFVIPIVPFDRVTPAPKYGTIIGYSYTVPVGASVQSICIDSTGLFVYLAYKGAATNIFIIMFSTAGFVQILDTLNTGHNTGVAKLTVSDQGRLIYFNTNTLTFFTPNATFGGLSTIYSIPTPGGLSITRNAYGCSIVP